MTNLPRHRRATVKAFKGWLAEKDPKERFCYFNNETCAFAQFLKDTGVCETPWVNGWDWGGDRYAHTYSIPASLIPILSAAGSFGALQKKLKVKPS
jgi:hypothetical protein